MSVSVDRTRPVQCSPAPVKTPSKAQKRRERTISSPFSHLICSGSRTSTGPESLANPLADRSPHLSYICRCCRAATEILLSTIYNDHTASSSSATGSSLLFSSLLSGDTTQVQTGLDSSQTPNTNTNTNAQKHQTDPTQARNATQRNARTCTEGGRSEPRQTADRQTHNRKRLSHGESALLR